MQYVIYNDPTKSKTIRNTAFPLAKPPKKPTPFVTVVFECLVQVNKQIQSNSYLNVGLKKYDFG